MIRKTILLLLLVFVYSDLYAVSSFYNMNYSKKNGLLSNTIERIERDKEGFLYFATNNGISVFDGMSFQNFNAQNTSDFSNSINAIRNLDSYHLIIGTLDKGLFIFDKKNDRIHRVECKGNAPSHIVDILKASDGSIWVATLEGNVWFVANGHSLLSSEPSRFVKIESSFPTIYSLSEYGGKVLVGSHSNRLISITRKGSQVLIEHSYNLPDTKAIHAFMHWQGKLWVGTDKGVILLTTIGGRWTIHREWLLNVPVRDISVMNGVVYAGTEGNGIATIEGERAEAKWIDYLKGKYIISLRGSKNGVLWVGTWAEGLYRIQMQSSFKWVSNLETRKDFLQNITWNIHPADEKDVYYIGTNGQGLCSYQKGNQRIELLSDKYPSIISFYSDPTSPILYVGTWGKGIRFWDKKRGTYTIETCPPIENDRVYAIERLKESGLILIGTSQSGAWIYDEKTKKAKQVVLSESLKNLNIRSFIQKGRGCWIATYNAGLFYLEFRKDGTVEKWKQYSDSEKKLLQIYSLCDDSNKLLLCLSDGLAYLDYKHLTIHRIPELEGVLIKSVVHTEDDDYWLATQTGLYHYNSKDGKVACYISAVEHYDLAYNRMSDELLCGTSAGLLSFPRKEVLKIGKYDRALIRDLYVDGNLIKPMDRLNEGYIRQSINYSDTVYINCDNQTLGLRLSCFSDNQGQDITLYYCMEGLDRSWNKQDAIGATAIYNNLPAGTYVFKVRLYDPNNTSGERQIIVIKAEYWWNTLWFKILSTLLLLSVVTYFLLYYYKKKYQKKLSIVEKEKEEEVIQQKIRFFTNISHDLKTPLTLLLSPLGDLKENPRMPDEFKDRLMSMSANGELLLKKINRILNYRDYADDKCSLYIESFSVDQLLYEIIFPYKEYAERQGLVFDLHSDNGSDGHALIQIDRDKFESIIENLVSNAIKYGREGGTVTIAYSVSEYKLSIRIINTGNVIPKDKLDKIFDKYYRIEKDNQGTGIGLWLVQQFIHQLKGEIEVSSNLESGTEFQITLPLKQLTLEQQTTTGESTEGESDENEYTLLIVDDNLEMRNYLKEIFSTTYRVLLAGGAHEALDLIEKEIPDLIVTDLMMPDMNGLELCRNIKSNILTSHIPLVVLSAKDTLDARIQCLEAGVDLYETKPFNSKLLAVKVETLIRNRRMLKYKYQLNPSNINANVFSKDSVESLDDKFIRKLNEAINSHMDNPDLSIEILASDLSMSHDQLYRKLKALTSYTVNQYVRSYRLNCAASMLKSKKYMVTEVLYSVGFNNPSYFTKCFKKEFGVLPSEYVDLN